MSLLLYSVFSLLAPITLSHSVVNSITHYEPNLLPGNSKGYCNVTNTTSRSPANACINTAGCGWCYNNQTGKSSCNFVGVCFYKGNLDDFTNCEILDNSISCNFIRLVGFFILLGVIVSSMSCSLNFLRYIMETTNCINLVYFVGVISVLLYSVIPVFLLYYTNFTTFCLGTLAQLSITAFVWLCGDTETVRRVYINKNHSEYQRIPDGETGALVN